MSGAPSLLWLLSPRLLAARGALRRGRAKPFVLGALAALFWIGCFVGFERTLAYFQTITALGPVLTQRLLVLIFVSFLAVLLLSNVVTALTTFYGAPEVNVLLAAPLTARRLHQARFIESLVASSWMALLFGLPAPLSGPRPGEPLFHLALLASTAAVLYLGSAALVERVFLRAWSRAQEGEAGGGRDRILSRWLPKLTAPLGRPANLLLAKEVTVFLRDPGQWSQLAVLLALVVVYVYNFSFLPLDDGSPLAAAMREMAALLNLGLAAFVTTSVAVRFVYPAPSLEGRSWWVLRTAPIPLAAIWRSKFTIGFVPLAVLAEVLVAVTNRFLGVPSGLTIVFMATLLLLVAAIVSLGIAFGAPHPRFDPVNPPQIATRFVPVRYPIPS